MKTQEGKYFLQDCLDQCRPNVSIDDLIIYKYATKNIVQLKDGIILAIVDEKKFTEHPHASYVVKYLRHDNAFVAWKTDSGRGNGNYQAFAKQVFDFLSSTETVQQVNVPQNGDAILFQRTPESGIEFVRDYLLKE